VYPGGNKAKMLFLNEKQLEEVGAVIYKAKDKDFLPTGRKRIIETMPEKLIQTSVGTVFHF
jgi:hypothetical protein